MTASPHHALPVEVLPRDLLAALPAFKRLPATLNAGGVFRRSRARDGFVRLERILEWKRLLARHLPLAERRRQGLGRSLARLRHGLRLVSVVALGRGVAGGSLGAARPVLDSPRGARALPADAGGRRRARERPAGDRGHDRRHRVDAVVFVRAR